MRSEYDTGSRECLRRMKLLEQNWVDHFDLPVLNLWLHCSTPNVTSPIAPLVRTFLPSPQSRMHLLGRYVSDICFLLLLEVLFERV